MSAATPLGFHARARRYMAASGREWDPHRMSLDQCTPAQRRRLMRKERRSWARHAVYAGWDEIGTPEAAGWGEPDGDERYAELQAEQYAAADLDEDWPRIPDRN